MTTSICFQRKISSKLTNGLKNNGDATNHNITVVFFIHPCFTSSYYSEVEPDVGVTL